MKRFLGFRNSRKIFTLVAFAAVTAFAVQANTDMKGQTKEVGGYKLELSFMANPVAVGKNQIMLKIEDSMMAAIEGAMVKTSSSMDRGMKMDSSAMSDQKPILLDLMKNPDASKKGEYMADIHFPS